MSAQVLQISPQEAISLQGKGWQGDSSVAVQVPRQLSVCSGIPIWHWAPPISKVEMPFFLLTALFSEYPPILLRVSKSHPFSSEEEEEARERLDGAWDDPQIRPLMEKKKSCTQVLCVCTSRMTQTPGLSLCHWQAWIKWFAPLLVLPVCGAWHLLLLQQRLALPGWSVLCPSDDGQKLL